MLVRCNFALRSTACKVHTWASTRIHAVAPILDSKGQGQGQGKFSSTSFRSIVTISPIQLQSLPRRGIILLLSRKLEAQSAPLILLHPVASTHVSYSPYCRYAYSNVAASAGGQQRKRLFLYSKEGCHLCDGLKVPLPSAAGKFQFLHSNHGMYRERQRVAMCRRKYRPCWTERSSCHLHCQTSLLRWHTMPVEIDALCADDTPHGLLLLCAC